MDEDNSIMNQITPRTRTERFTVYPTKHPLHQKRGIMSFGADFHAADNIRGLYRPRTTPQVATNGLYTHSARDYAGQGPLDRTQGLEAEKSYYRFLLPTHHPSKFQVGFFIGTCTIRGCMA